MKPNTAEQLSRDDTQDEAIRNAPMPDSPKPAKMKPLSPESLEMVKRIAGRFGRGLPAWISRDDLVAAGNRGLVEAAKRYDETRREPFEAFAEKRIRGAMLDELRRGDIMPRRIRQKAKEVTSAIRHLEQRLGRPPEDEETAAALGVSVAEYRDSLKLLPQVTLVSFGDETEVKKVAFEGQTPEEAATRAQSRDKLRLALSKLPERERKILSLYYVDELEYKEIAKIMGVSQSRICQLANRALVSLRELLPDFEGQN